MTKFTLLRKLLPTTAVFATGAAAVYSETLQMKAFKEKHPHAEPARVFQHFPGVGSGYVNDYSKPVYPLNAGLGAEPLFAQLQYEAQVEKQTKLQVKR